MNLQEDEVEFSNEIFREIANKILEVFLLKGFFDKSSFFNEYNDKYQKIIVDIQMEDEKYTLDGWLEKKQVFVKSKDDTAVIREHTLQTLYTYREFLVQKIINDLMHDFLESEDDLSKKTILEYVADYNKLKTEISNNIRRVRTDYFKK